MIRIGDFSKLAQVTIKTLRHYDMIGLFRPVWIDRYNGYRYYALEQLPRLNRILVLKNLGFSLDEIQFIIQQDLSTDALRELLLRRQVELENRIQEEQARLNQVEARLRQIEEEGHPRRFEATIKEVPSQKVAAARCMLPSLNTLPEAFTILQGEIGGWLGDIGLKEDGPWQVIYDDPNYSGRNIDIEIAVPVSGRIKRQVEHPRFALQTLPAVREMASTLHAETHNALPKTLAELYNFIYKTRYRVAGPNRELMLQQPDPSIQHPTYIEVQVPVEPAVSITLSEKEIKMEPRFVNRDAMLVVGYLYQGKNANNEIPKMWGEFNPRCGEIKTVAQLCYGVCWMEGDLPEGEFKYMAGCEVASEEDIPEGMVLTEVPAQKYVVFEHRGPISKLGETYRDIYQKWLPEWELERGDGPELEEYDDTFETEDRFLIYIPVK